MQNTVVVLRACLSREVYTRHAEILHAVKNFSKETTKILATIADYYERFPERDHITLAELRVFFYEENPVVDQDKYDLEFEHLGNAEILNPDLVQEVLKRVVEQHTCAELYQVAINTVQGVCTDGLDQIREILNKHEERQGKGEDLMDLECTEPIEKILSEKIEGAIPWGLDVMNEILGPLPTARLGHIFCRPDVGKTAMALFQLAAMAFHTRKDPSTHFLYLNNEESIRTLRVRLYCSMLGWDQDHLLKDPEGARKIFASKGGNKIHLFGDVLSILDVEKYVARVRPVVVVIDQGPKLTCPGKELSEVEKKQHVYNRLRRIGIQYNTSVISLGQADSDADGKKYPGLANLDGSKVGIPGELDWCMAIGKVEDAGYESVRFLNVCKNKLTGKLGRGAVLIDIPLCRYRNQGSMK